MKLYQTYINESGISALKTLIGGKSFYMTFPYIFEDKGRGETYFETGTLYVSFANKVYALNVSSKWRESETDWLDYKEIVLDIDTADDRFRGCSSYYDPSDPERKSSLIFPEFEISSVTIYECKIEGPNETVVYDSHIVFGSKNGRGIIFEFESNISDRVKLTVTDEKNTAEVIRKYDYGELECSIAVRTVIENG